MYSLPQQSRCENLFHKNKKTSTYGFMCHSVYNDKKLKLLVLGEWLNKWLDINWNE